MEYSALFAARRLDPARLDELTSRCVGRYVELAASPVINVAVGSKLGVLDVACDYTPGVLLRPFGNCLPISGTPKLDDTCLP